MSEVVSESKSGDAGSKGKLKGEITGASAGLPGAPMDEELAGRVVVDKVFDRGPIDMRKSPPTPTASSGSARQKSLLSGIPTPVLLAIIGLVVFVVMVSMAALAAVGHR